jgi:hypothetical protein
MSNGYTVTWEIDIDAEQASTPREAAWAAIDHLRRSHSIAHVFEVLEHGRPVIESVRVDLDRTDEEPAVKGCSCGEADYGAPGHDGDLADCEHEITEVMLTGGEFRETCCDCGRLVSVGGSPADFAPTVHVITDRS